MKPYYESGEDERVLYFRDELRMLHNLEGLAIVYKYKHWDSRYYVRGVHLTEGQFNRHPEVIKYRNYLKLKEALGL